MADLDFVALFAGQRTARPRSFIYVASPYSHADPAVRVERYREANRFIRFAAERGVPVHSPIAHWHIAALGEHGQGALAVDHLSWMWQNHAMLAAASALIVLALPGYPHSAGVRDELRMAGSLGLPCGIAWLDRGGWLIEPRDAAKLLGDCYLHMNGGKQ